jgi:stearoyl-CoA desaturase (Delta-9 desaturase)
MPSSTARSPGDVAQADLRAARRGTPETIPVMHEASERIVRTLVIGLPPVALVCAGWLAWGGVLHWQDLVVLALSYTLSGLGVTVGFHRLFTHRSFNTTRVLRALFAVLGSTAVEGPVTEWVATHRRHHQFSDRPGDPHSPHVGVAGGWRGSVRGLAHAHVGWMFRGRDMANPRRYAKDVLADRDLRFIGRTFPLWVLVGLAVPFGLGAALTGSLAGGLTGLLWGGAVRVLLLHHATFSITRCVTSSAGGRSARATNRATSRGWPRSRWGRAGTTTTMRSRRPHVTAWGVGSSIRVPA